MRSDRRLTVCTVATRLDMQKDSVWKIITDDSGMQKVCAKMVPRLLNADQKERRMEVRQHTHERLQTEADLLGRVITGDGS